MNNQNFRASIVEVTPKMAAEWLARSHDNRPIQAKWVDQYTRDILSGRWAMNGEAIKLDERGNLLDGQHRLSAIVKAGQSIKTVVEENVPADAFLTLDTGVPKSIPVLMDLMGMDYVNQRSAILRMVWRIQQARLAKDPWIIGSNKIAPSKAEILDMHPNWPEVDTALRLAHRVKDVVGRSSVVLGFYAALLRSNAVLSTEFFTRLIDGCNLPEGSPVGLLRNKLIADKGSKRKMSQAEFKAFIIKAWNAYIDGRPMYALKRDKRESYPELRFPSALGRRAQQELSEIQSHRDQDQSSACAAH